MFTRIRWFVYGAAVTLVLAIVVIRRARLLRERLDAEGVVRISAGIAADGLEAVGRRMQRSTLRPVDDGAAEGTG